MPGAWRYPLAESFLQLTCNHVLSLEQNEVLHCNALAQQRYKVSPTPLERLPGELRDAAQLASSHSYTALYDVMSPSRQRRLPGRATLALPVASDSSVDTRAVRKSDLSRLTARQPCCLRSSRKQLIVTSLVSAKLARSVTSTCASIARRVLSPASRRVGMRGTTSMCTFCRDRMYDALLA